LDDGGYNWSTHSLHVTKDQDPNDYAFGSSLHKPSEVTLRFHPKRKCLG
jgi:hypothetical protein